MDDRTQQSDRPSRKVLTGIAVAACGGVIALLVEYLVLQVWLAPEVKPWNSNTAPKQVAGVVAHGEVTRADGRLTVTGHLEDKGDDDRGALVIFFSKGTEIGRTANIDGPHQTIPFNKNYPETVENLAVRECLTHQEKAVQLVVCSEPLVIWPQHSPQAVSHGMSSTSDGDPRPHQQPASSTWSIP